MNENADGHNRCANGALPTSSYPLSSLSASSSPLSSLPASSYPLSSLPPSSYPLSSLPPSSSPPSSLPPSSSPPSSLPPSSSPPSSLPSSSYPLSSLPASSYPLSSPSSPLSFLSFPSPPLSSPSPFQTWLPIESPLQRHQMDQDQDYVDMQSSPRSSFYEELYNTSRTSNTVVPRASTLVPSSGPHSDVLKHGYLGKQDWNYRRYFVLRARSHTGLGRLEWYKNREKFIAMETSAGKAAQFGSNKQGVIYLRCCLGVSQSGSSRRSRMVALHARDNTMVLVAQDQLEQEEWYQALKKVMEKEQKDENFSEQDDVYSFVPPATLFKEVWRVMVKPRGLGRSKSLAGESRLCLTATSLILIRVTARSDLPSITIPFLSVQSFGHLDRLFYLELGMSAPKGPGEIWMEARDQGNTAVAQRIHDAVRDSIRAQRGLPDFCWSPTSNHNQLQTSLNTKCSTLPSSSSLSSLPASSYPLSSLPAPSSPLSSLPASSHPLSSLPAPSHPLSSLPASSHPLSSLPAPSSPLSSLPAPSSPLSSLPASSSPLSSLPAPSSPLSSLPASSHPLSSLPAPSSPLSSLPASSHPLSSLPASSYPLSSLPASSYPLSSPPAPSSPLSSLSSPSSPLSSPSSPLSSPSSPLLSPSPFQTWLPVESPLQHHQMEQDQDCVDMQSSPWSRFSEELYDTSRTFNTVVPLSGTLVHSSGPQSDVLKQGYLGKQDWNHRRYFVLRARSHTGLGRLEWYKNRENFRAMETSARKVAQFGSNKQGVIYLRWCLGVSRSGSRSGSSRKGHMVFLYARDQTVVLVAEDQLEQDEWYQALEKLMEKEQKDEEHGGGFGKEDDVHCTVPPATLFKEVWPVTVTPRGLGQSKSLAGESRLCLTATSLILVRVTTRSDVPPVTIPLLSVRRFGHLDRLFFLELGRSAPNGPGEIWMEARDQGDTAVAQHIHEAVRDTVRAQRGLPDLGWSPASNNNQLQTSQDTVSCRPKCRDKVANVRPRSSRLAPRNLDFETSPTKCYEESHKPHKAEPESSLSSTSHLSPVRSHQSSMARETSTYVEMKMCHQLRVTNLPAAVTGDQRSAGVEGEPGEEESEYMMMSPQVSPSSSVLPENDYMTRACPKKPNGQACSFLQTSFNSATSVSDSPRRLPHYQTSEHSQPHWPLRELKTEFGHSQRRISFSSDARQEQTSAEPSRRPAQTRATSSPVRSVDGSGVMTPFVTCAPRYTRAVQAGPHPGTDQPSQRQAASDQPVRRNRLRLWLPSCLQPRDRP